MRTLFAAAMTLSLVTGTVATAYADGRDHDWHESRDDDRRDDRHHDRDDRRHDRHDDRRDDARYSDHRRDYRTGYAHGRHDQRRYDYGRYVRPRGYQYRSWRNGDRLPAAYYSGRHIVRDYHSYRLRPPPRGYHWVRVDNDVLLAAVATGVVVQIVNGLFY